MCKYILAVFSVFYFSTKLFAQSEPATTPNSRLTETGSWNGLYLKVRLTDKLYYYGEHHYRRRNSADNLYDFVGRMRQVYNRAGLNYFFNEYFNVVIGPTLVFNYTPRPGNPEFEKVTLEPRIWHQWLLKMPAMGRVNIYHQFRFEHRWKRSNEKGASFDYTDRYRYKIFAYIPMNTPNMQNRTLFLAPSAEIFMHTGKSIVYNVYEDFRIYTALGYILNKNVMLFGGHMWTIGQDPTGFEYSQSHIIRLNVFLTFDMYSRRINKRKSIPIILDYNF